MNEIALFPAITPKTYQGQRVVTLRDIDELHQRVPGTAWRNFSENRKHFVDGLDYNCVTRENQNNEIRGFDIGKRGTLVFTLTGYLMIVKSFTDDLSWQIQRELVTGYFSGCKAGNTFRGTPVITLKEYCAATGENRHTACGRLKARYGEIPLEAALYLEGWNLRLFKRENPGTADQATTLWILTREGAERLRAMKKIALP